ncbi:MAG TPA: hypothetical protein VKB76_17165, partial [Ktedonobacterales bacterium]|nr:hypothetical protein [Ktedonobacterales bacterium]
MMDDIPLPQERDDSEIIVDSVASSDAPGGTPRLPHRLALRTLFAALTLFLLAVFIISALPPLRAAAVNVVFGPTVAPTSVLSQVVQHIYITSNLPWGIVSLDGKPLAHLPEPQEEPLRLARGHHVITFHAAPFLPLSCTISLPGTVNDTCLFKD